jgi:hypothetical protein
VAFVSLADAHCFVHVCNYVLLQVSQNKLTLAVLELCMVLVSFGAFGAIESVVTILGSLTGLLNGVSDVVNPEDKVWTAQMMSSSLCPTRVSFVHVLPLFPSLALGLLVHHSTSPALLLALDFAAGRWRASPR